MSHTVQRFTVNDIYGKSILPLDSTFNQTFPSSFLKHITDQHSSESKTFQGSAESGERNFEKKKTKHTFLLLFKKFLFHFQGILLIGIVQKAMHPEGPQSPEGPMLPLGPTRPVNWFPTWA